MVCLQVVSIYYYVNSCCHKQSFSSKGWSFSMGGGFKSAVGIRLQFCDPPCTMWYTISGHTPLHIMVSHLLSIDHVHTCSTRHCYNKQENYLLDKNGST